MEQTTLQQRIEERAKNKLLKDLYDAGQKEKEISDFLGKEVYPCSLHIRQLYNSYNRGHVYDLMDDFAKSLFNKLLPGYVSDLTDEILRKMDEIDYLVNSKQEVEDLP